MTYDMQLLKGLLMQFTGGDPFQITKQPFNADDLSDDLIKQIHDFLFSDSPKPELNRNDLKYVVEGFAIVIKRKGIKDADGLIKFYSALVKRMRKTLGD